MLRMCEWNILGTTRGYSAVFRQEYNRGGEESALPAGKLRNGSRIKLNCIYFNQTTGSGWKKPRCLDTLVFVNTFYQSETELLSVDKPKSLQVNEVTDTPCITAFDFKVWINTAYTPYGYVARECSSIIYRR